MKTIDIQILTPTNLWQTVGQAYDINNQYLVRQLDIAKTTFKSSQARAVDAVTGEMILVR